MSIYTQNGAKDIVRTVGALKKSLERFDDNIELLGEFCDPCAMSVVLMQDKDTGDNYLNIDEDEDADDESFDDASGEEDSDDDAD